jgi:cell division protein FtsL
MYPSSQNPLIQNSFLGSKYLDPNYLFSRLVEIWGYIFNATNLEILYVILSIFAIFFIAIIIYTTIRMFEIRKKEHVHLHQEIEEYARDRALKEEENQEVGVFKNERWKKVLDYLFSANENDWKLAIIEADSILFDLLTQLKFKGDTLGDKLKEADRDTFHSLSLAWEAHNIRNKIAHEGSSFEVSLHEAKRIITLYEQIFQEFGYI